MINFKSSLAAIAVILLCAACATVKIPASDNKALTKYDREIACVKSTDISAERRYAAAEVLFEKLDFSYIRDVESLNAVLGKGARTASFDGDRLQYTYSYGNKSITAIFWNQGHSIVRSNVIYKDASKPMKQSPKYLPDSARGAAEESTAGSNVNSNTSMPVNAIKKE